MRDGITVVDHGDAVETLGLAYGPSTHRRLAVHWRQGDPADPHAGDVLVLKVPGHKSWAGRGQDWEYTPTHFLVLERVDEGPRNAPRRGGQYREVAHFPLTAPRRLR